MTLVPIGHELDGGQKRAMTTSCNVFDKVATYQVDPPGR